MLRLRSDEQLVALFRSGHDEAFQVLYDRYHKRLESYARQMLVGSHDAEDALQDVFVRAYRALHADNRQLAVKAWLFRIVHNRCIDELRRAAQPPPEELMSRQLQAHDPVVQADTREVLRRLLEDIGRLPEQQRSALLLRELSGVSYVELATILDTTVPAVKSLLVRARMGLVRASAARDTACSEIREELVAAHDQGVRAGPTVRNHLRDCPACRSYRREVFLVRRRLAGFLPVGPVAALTRLLGVSGSSATGSGGAAPAAALGTSGTASGVAVGANHVAALLAAAMASAGGAVGLQHVIASVAQTPPQASSAHRDHDPGSAPGTGTTGLVTSAGAATSLAMPVWERSGQNAISAGRYGSTLTAAGGARHSPSGSVSGHGSAGSTGQGLPGSLSGTSGSQTGLPPSLGGGSSSGSPTSGSGSGVVGTGSSQGSGSTPPAAGGSTSGSGSSSTGSSPTDLGGTTSSSTGSSSSGTGSSGTGSSGTGSSGTGSSGTGSSGTGSSGTGSSSTGSSSTGSSDSSQGTSTTTSSGQGTTSTGDGSNTGQGSSSGTSTPGAIS